MGFGVPRADYFSENNKITKVFHFDPKKHYQKMQKGIVLSIGGHEHDPRSSKEPTKPMKLMFGDHGLQNMR